MNKYVAIGLFSVLVSCFSQVLLKKSTFETWSSKLREYANIYVISGYFLITVSVFMTIFMYKGLDLKYGAIIESTSYLMILILSRVFFKELLTQKKIIGNILIIVGIIVFNI